MIFHLGEEEMLLRRVLCCMLFTVAILSAQQSPSLLQRINAEASKAKWVEFLSPWVGSQGPRTTGSPAMQAAGERLQKTLREMGMRAWKEPWEGFGTSWSYTYSGVRLTSPQNKWLKGRPSPWSQSGQVTAKLKYAPVPTTTDLERIKVEYPKYYDQYKDNQLRGTIVLFMPPLTKQPPQADSSLILSEAELLRLSTPPAPCPTFEAPWPLLIPLEPEARRCFFLTAPTSAVEKIEIYGKDLGVQLIQFLYEQGVVGILRPAREVPGGMRMSNTNSRRPQHFSRLPQMVVLEDEYTNLVQLAQKGDVEVEMRVDSQFHTLKPFNVFAELKGSSNEVVMFGAHFDTEPFSQGVSDNAVSVAMLIEAMRIVKSLGITTKRTIRAAFWSGEEQGLLGSLAYKKSHQKELPKLRMYTNLDSGAGRIRGVNIYGQETLATVVANWLQPFKAAGNGHVLRQDPNPSGRSDDQVFREAGVPSVNLVPDPLDYDYVAHTTADRLENLSTGHISENSSYIAWLMIQAANQENIPR